MSFNNCCSESFVIGYSIIHNPAPIQLSSEILELIEKLLWYAPGIKSAQSIPNLLVDDNVWAEARFNLILSNMGINITCDIVIGAPTAAQTAFFKTYFCTNCQKIVFSCPTNETKLKAFLRHIRNAIAHGNFQIIDKTAIFFDYNKSNVNTAIIKVNVDKFYAALQGVL